MMTIRLIGQWGAASDVFGKLVVNSRNAARTALNVEAQRFHQAVKQGLQSGAPGGKKFAALSPLTLALHGPGRGILRRTETMLSEIVVVRQGDNVAITVRGSRARVADIHEGGRVFKRPLTPKQRRFLFAAMRNAGIGGKGEGGGGSSFRDGANRLRDSKGKFLSKEQRAALVGMTVIPARPFFAPVAAKYFKNMKAAERRVANTWLTFMGLKGKYR